MRRLIWQIFAGLIGRVCLFIRYGKKSKEVVDREYLGMYWQVGNVVLLQIFSVFFLILIGSALILLIMLSFKKLYSVMF